MCKHKEEKPVKGNCVKIEDKPKPGIVDRETSLKLVSI